MDLSGDLRTHSHRARKMMVSTSLVAALSGVLLLVPFPGADGIIVVRTSLHAAAIFMVAFWPIWELHIRLQITRRRGAAGKVGREEESEKRREGGGRENEPTKLFYSSTILYDPTRTAVYNSGMFVIFV